MTAAVLERMGGILAGLQESRALTNLEVVAQLNDTISDFSSEMPQHKLSEHAWNQWKHGRTTPRPAHRRILAKWVGPPATPEALFRGLIRLDWNGDVTLADQPEGAQKQRGPA